MNNSVSQLWSKFHGTVVLSGLNCVVNALFNILDEHFEIRGGGYVINLYVTEINRMSNKCVCLKSTVPVSEIYCSGVILGKIEISFFPDPTWAKFIIQFVRRARIWNETRVS